VGGDCVLAESAEVKEEAEGGNGKGEAAVFQKEAMVEAEQAHGKEKESARLTRTGRKKKKNTTHTWLRAYVAQQKNFPQNHYLDRGNRE